VARREPEPIWHEERDTEKVLAINEPKTMAALLARILPYHVVPEIPDKSTLSYEETVAQLRERSGVLETDWMRKRKNRFHCACSFGLAEDAICYLTIPTETHADVRFKIADQSTLRLMQASGPALEQETQP
jgi:hypothetical protein